MSFVNLQVLYSYTVCTANKNDDEKESIKMLLIVPSSLTMQEQPPKVGCWWIFQLQPGSNIGHPDVSLVAIGDNIYNKILEKLLK